MCAGLCAQICAQIFSANTSARVVLRTAGLRIRSYGPRRDTHTRPHAVKDLCARGYICTLKWLNIHCGLGQDEYCPIFC